MRLQYIILSSGNKKQKSRGGKKKDECFDSFLSDGRLQTINVKSGEKSFLAAIRSSFQRGLDQFVIAPSDLSSLSKKMIRDEIPAWAQRAKKSFPSIDFHFVTF